MDARRFDQLEKVVRDTRRKLDDHSSTVLARLGSHTHPGGGGGVTDHGALTGLGDDDHTQYHNDTRGDARYHRRDQAISTTTANFFDLQESHKATGDTNNRHETYADGYQKWGPGNAATDAVLYRQAAGHLKTDGRFEADDITLSGADLDTTLAAKVPTSRTISVGDGLTGGGDLSANRTISLATSREARYYQSGTGQVIPNITDRMVYLNSSTYTTSDVTRTLGTTSTGSSFTINRAGLWLLSGAVRYLPGGTAAAERYMTIANGALTVRYTHAAINPGASGPVTLNASTQIRFAVGDVVAMWVYQSSGGNLTLDIGWDGISLSLAWLRP